MVLCVPLGLFGCQEAGEGPRQDCNGGKCDSLDDTAGTDVMGRAPYAPGTISITRNAEQWLCEVIGSRGEIALLSDPYTSRSSALNGALAIEENGVLPERYSVADTGSGWTFKLRAGNGVALAEGLQFATQAEAQEAAVAARDLVAGIVQFKAAVTDGARFALSRDGSRWTFDLFGEDGSVVMTSQVYSRRADAITGIESVRENGKNPARYQVLDGPPRFVLEAGNGEEIAESGESFDSLEAAQAAVASSQTLLVTERVANPW